MMTMSLLRQRCWTTERCVVVTVLKSPKQLLSSISAPAATATTTTTATLEPKSVSHTTSTLVATEPTTGLSKGCLGEIVRHGSGDACITLNVGGKEFYTLRSTINTNAVLAEHVARAAVNHEISIKNGNVVFIDRDPEQFSYILKHLRNRAEQATARHYEKSSSSLLTKQSKSSNSIYIDLPEDPHVLSDLYVEAVYYRIPELQNALRKYSMTAHVSYLLKKQWNPFDFFTKLFLQIRVGALAAGTVGGTWYMSLQHDWDTTLRKWGLRK